MLQIQKQLEKLVVIMLKEQEVEVLGLLVVLLQKELEKVKIEKYQEHQLVVMLQIQKQLEKLVVMLLQKELEKVEIEKYQKQHVE